MTCLVFESGILTIATESWCATELRDPKTPMVQVHVLGSPAVAQCNLAMALAEFLSIVAEGGKVVDLRGIQESPRRMSHADYTEQRKRAVGELPAWPD